ncbi:helix-turn-helix domain-containing protein [Corynebacterium fournieri]|uniref:helix-turn-helix domain-containing protein n=1 Tax=Corynebacterium fournieri TaxID=1852390 RepID=UPI000A2F188E|nr:helix-turn-helix transcriptional regulator [Corynebacterium fournieri]WJY97767.1 Transcriptional regulator ClgR [Corynebacterium fournieri]
MTTTTLLHETPVELPLAPAGAAPESAERSREPLFREALGMSLRAFRADKGVTLRALAKEARVSSGYISELERGRKEVSSELLASLCEALGTTVSEVLLEAVANMSLHSFTEELERTSPAAAEA